MEVNTGDLFAIIGEYEVGRRVMEKQLAAFGAKLEELNGPVAGEEKSDGDGNPDIPRRRPR